MCTFNIALDDEVVSTARKSFSDDASLTTWIEEQVNILLAKYVSSPEIENRRKPHKHDSLMGVISGAQDLDLKRIHLKEKYDSYELWKTE